jgi:excisionase family DNA binding protein
MTILSVADCAKMVGVSNRTIQNKIKTGKLSATRDGNGYYKIDSSEFIRVYPDAKKIDDDSRNQNEDIKFSEELQNKLVAQELEFMKRENADLKAQLNKADNREKSLMETVQSNARLLEHQAEPRRKVFGIF